LIKLFRRRKKKLKREMEVDGWRGSSQRMLVLELLLLIVIDLKLPRAC